MVETRTDCGGGRVEREVLIVHHPRHAAFHVIEQVAVKKPVAELFRRKLDYCGCHGGDINGVLERRVVTLSVEHPEEMPVQMHRVMHHGAVDHDEAHDFIAFDFNVIGFGERFVVEKPDITHHVAVKCQSNFSDGFVWIEGGGLQGAELVRSEEHTSELKSRH